MNQKTKPKNADNGNSNRPTHTARRRTGHGKNAGFETLGVAWDRDDGSFYVKPYGTQLIEGGFYLFPVTQDQADETAD